MPRPPERSDEEIVRSVRAGDASAAAMLLDRHLPTLRARTRGRMPRALQAKVGASDIVQDALIAAFMGLGEFEDRGDGSFQRWLRQILEHKILDAERRFVGADKRSVSREARFRTDTSGVASGLASAAPSPSAEVAGAEQSAALRAAVDSLAEDYRTVIRLVHHEGLTLADAGTSMGRSAEAARKLYGRALALLADRMGGSQGGPR